MTAAAYRPRALQDASGNDALDTFRLGRQQATQCKQYQPPYDHRLAPNAIREHAERDLEHRLGETIGADGHSNEQGRGTIKRLTIGRKHRQHHEQTQHAKGEYSRERARGAAFCRRHGISLVHGFSGNREKAGF